MYAAKFIETCVTTFSDIKKGTVRLGWLHGEEPRSADGRTHARDDKQPG